MFQQPSDELPIRQYRPDEAKDQVDDLRLHTSSQILVQLATLQRPACLTETSFVGIEDIQFNLPVAVRLPLPGHYIFSRYRGWIALRVIHFQIRTYRPHRPVHPISRHRSWLEQK